MYYVYNGFHVFDFIAHCWATFNALRALLSSHIITNKNDDDDDKNDRFSFSYRTTNDFCCTVKLLCIATFARAVFVTS